jgi:hypothetical protein
MCPTTEWKTGKVKIVEPNKGKHIAVDGDISIIVASKEDTGGAYSFIEIKVFPGGVLLYTFKHAKMKVFTLLKVK